MQTPASPPPARDARRRYGFTLTEVVVAAFLVATVGVALLGHLVAETHFARTSRDSIVAERLAADVIERLRLEPVDRLAGVLGTAAAGRVWVEADPLLSPPDLPPDEVRVLERFDRSAWVEAAPGGEDGVLRVRVTWTEAGRDREVKACTVLLGHP